MKKGMYYKTIGIYTRSDKYGDYDTTRIIGTIDMHTVIDLLKDSIQEIWECWGMCPDFYWGPEGSYKMEE